MYHFKAAKVGITWMIFIHSIFISFDGYLMYYEIFNLCLLHFFYENLYIESNGCPLKPIEDELALLILMQRKTIKFSARLCIITTFIMRNFLSNEIFLRFSKFGAHDFRNLCLLICENHNLAIAMMIASKKK